MFQFSQLEMARLQHSHGGEWHDLTEVTPAHDSAEGDPERSWVSGRVFRCSTCEHEIRIVAQDEAPPSQR